VCLQLRKTHNALPQRQQQAPHTHTPSRPLPLLAPPQVVTPAAAARSLLRLHALRAAAASADAFAAEGGAPAPSWAALDCPGPRDCLWELDRSPDTGLPQALLVAEEAWLLAPRLGLRGAWLGPARAEMLRALRAEVGGALVGACMAEALKRGVDPTDLFGVAAAGGGGGWTARAFADAARAVAEAEDDAAAAPGGAGLGDLDLPRAAFLWPLEGAEGEAELAALLRRVPAAKGLVERIHAEMRGGGGGGGGDDDDAAAAEARRAVRLLMQAGWPADAPAQGAWCSAAAEFHSHLVIDNHTPSGPPLSFSCA
jgi:hypothetical protein